MSRVLGRSFQSLSRRCSLPSKRLSPCQSILSQARLHNPRTYSTEATVTKSSSPQPPSLSAQSSPTDSSVYLAKHLSTLFSPLQFPQELATRILTHASHRDAHISHNARLSFIGRRVLKSYLLLMLHSSGTNLDYDYITEKVLHTHVLGEFVAPKWDLGRVMRWTPVNIDPRVASAATGELDHLDPKLSWSIGLYKVQGTAVEAVIGGIYHQFGGSVAHNVFHTRLLPHILLPGRPEGLPDSLHDHALKICQQLGGVNAPLVSGNSNSA
ncbi:ribonuclease-III-like-domain-containing protein [Abortiporus biennis]|nr:ribonuclease-III-like-domain-containing protein [Abortiporus biennis]